MRQFKLLKIITLKRNKKSSQSINKSQQDKSNSWESFKVFMIRKKLSMNKNKKNNKTLPKNK